MPQNNNFDHSFNKAYQESHSNNIRYEFNRMLEKLQYQKNLQKEIQDQKKHSDKKITPKDMKEEQRIQSLIMHNCFREQMDNINDAKIMQND